jgi:hypothetical protein
MNEKTGTVAAHEAYAFACMRCGHGWEQSFDIEHHADDKGKISVVYRTNGLRVPSPLSSPSCPMCEGHVVRIMASGAVASVREMTRSYGSAGLASGAQPLREKAQRARAEKAAYAVRAGLLPEYDGAGAPAEGEQEGERARHAHPHLHLHLPEFLRNLLHHQRA